jgi:hypothetical protein
MEVSMDERKGKTGHVNSVCLQHDGFFNSSALEAVPVPPRWGVPGLAFHIGGVGCEDGRLVADQANRRAVRC